MHPKVDLYLANGCGRCPLGGTPQCKVHNWPEVLVQLRRIVLDCGLAEELKWGVPCYTFQQSNVAVIAAFKEYAALSFFKGTLLHDANKLLIAPGEHTQSARFVPFTDVQQIVAIEAILKAYIYEAIEVEKAGLKVDFKEKATLILPQEFQDKLAANPALRAAFDALTPGRKRAYNLYFSAPKQSKTRTARIEKCMPQIFAGKGLND